MVFNTSYKQIMLLTELRKNARQSLTKISGALRIPISTAHDRMRSTLNDVVKKYTCILDFSKLGFSCRTQIILKVKKEEKDEIRDYLVRNENINSVYRINNGYDFLVEGVFKDMCASDDFLERLGDKFKIREQKIYYIMEDIAREMFLTDNVHANMVMS